MSTQTTVKHNSPKVIEHTMVPSRTENTESSKPLLQSILQTETASAFTKKPSNAYQIEYTSSIYNPEDINSMAASSSKLTTFVPTKATVRPMSIKTTTKTNEMITSTSPKNSEHAKNNENYVQPETYAGWPVYNLIIEGHSKVKNYGLKNIDEIESNLPKIRPVQGKENPIVERVTKNDEGPEFNFKHLQTKKSDSEKNVKISNENQKSTMTSIWSMLDSSFGNFLSGESSDISQLESSGNKVGKLNKQNTERRRMRRSTLDIASNENENESVFSASFQVDDEDEKFEPQMYRKGTVISEKLWPF